MCSQKEEKENGFIYENASTIQLKIYNN